MRRIGTLGAQFGDAMWTLDNTTPLALELHELLGEMRDARRCGRRDGGQLARARARARVDDVRFRVAALTNVTRDHLDFHGTLEAYAAAKRRSSKRAAVGDLNVDDPLGRHGRRSSGASASGRTGSASCRRACGRRRARPARQQLYARRSALQPAPAGPLQRLQRACGDRRRAALRHRRSRQRERACRDRTGAGTDGDASRRAASTSSSTTRTRPTRWPTCCARCARPRTARLIAVFGCGGDRDRGKRAEMGASRPRWPTASIVTSDNPRSEEPAAIVEDILAGIDEREAVGVELDRRAAIQRAIGEAQRRRQSSWPAKATKPTRSSARRVGHFDDRDEVRGALPRARRQDDRRAGRRDRRSGARVLSGASFRRGRSRSRPTRARSNPARRSSRCAASSFDGHDFAAQAAARGAAALVVADAAVVPTGVPALVVADTTSRCSPSHGWRALVRAQRSRRSPAAPGRRRPKLFCASCSNALPIGALRPRRQREQRDRRRKLLLGLERRRRRARRRDGCAPLRRYRAAGARRAARRRDPHQRRRRAPRDHGLARAARGDEVGALCDWRAPVLNADDAVSRRRAPTLGERVEWFATRASGDAAHEPAGARQTLLVGRERLVVHEPGGSRTFAIACDVPGDHNLANLAAAVAGALALGVPAERVAAAIPGLVLPRGPLRARAHRRFRGDLRRVQRVDERHARDARRVRARRRRGGSRCSAGWRSSGTTRPQCTSESARPRPRRAWTGCWPAASLRPSSHAARALPVFRPNARALRHERRGDRAGCASDAPGDVVLLKGSRSYKLEEIVEGLRAVYA